MTLSDSNIGKLQHNNKALLLMDLGISTLASVLAILFVRWQIHAVFEFEHHFIFWVIAALVASLVAALIFGAHKVVLRHSTFRSMGKIIYAVFVKEVLLALCLLFNLFNIMKMEAPLLLLFIDLGMTMLFLIGYRILIISILNTMSTSIEKDVDRLSVMVYGTSDKSVAMVTRLDQSKEYNIVGFLTRDKERAGQIISDYKVYWFETESDMVKLKANQGVECVLFAREQDAEEEQQGLVKMCLACSIHILLTPRISSITYNGLSTHSIKQIVDSDFIPDGMTSFERNTKRSVDCALAALLLIVFSPLFLICFVALKIGDKGPAIFSQERIGRFGKPFKIYKFRSMRMDAEKDGPALLAGEDDPRQTKVGRFLRSHHLDELPQLWNVFCGDMAFVGPRPERKYFIDQIMEQDPRYYYLFQIRPGVTSYATLKNGYTDTMDKMLRRLEFDLYYLKHRSWWFDIKILWQTFRSIIFGKKF